MEKEPDTGTHQVLTQIATLVGIDLGARVIEVVVFDKRAPLVIKEVIRPGDNLPRQVRMTCPPASVDWDSTGYWIPNLDPRRFGIVNADPAARIRLKSSKRESPDEVRHERARIDPSSHVALCYNITKAIPQGEVSAAPEAVPEKVAFNGRTKYTRAKDVTEFNAAVAADVILRVDLQSGIKIPIGWVVNAVFARKRSVSTAVLIDIGPSVDRTVKTEPVKFRRRWWRGDLLVDLLSGLERSGEKSNYHCG